MMALYIIAAVGFMGWLVSLGVILGNVLAWRSHNV